METPIVKTQAPYLCGSYRLYKMYHVIPFALNMLRAHISSFLNVLWIQKCCFYFLLWVWAPSGTTQDAPGPHLTGLVSASRSTYATEENWKTHNAKGTMQKDTDWYWIETTGNVTIQFNKCWHDSDQECLTILYWYENRRQCTMMEIISKTLFHYRSTFWSDTGWRQLF